MEILWRITGIKWKNYRDIRWKIRKDKMNIVWFQVHLLLRLYAFSLSKIHVIFPRSFSKIGLIDWLWIGSFLLNPLIANEVQTLKEHEKHEEGSIISSQLGQYLKTTPMNELSSLFRKPYCFCDYRNVQNRFIDKFFLRNQGSRILKGLMKRLNPVRTIIETSHATNWKTIPRAPIKFPRQFLY